MIGMSRRGQLVRFLVVAASLFLAGCCGGGGSAHKCDFTEAPNPDAGRGSDAPVACGVAVCQPPQVCCLKKVPPVAYCIDVQDFEDQGCEKADLPCLVPTDCPAGLSCCLDRAKYVVSCRPTMLCPAAGGTTEIACASDRDCPPEVPSCQILGQATDGTTLSTCAGYSAAPPPGTN
jgi:hypothetical protein